MTNFLCGFVAGLALLLVISSIVRITEKIKSKKKSIELKYLDLFNDNIHLVKKNFNKNDLSSYTLNLSGIIFEIKNNILFINNENILNMPENTNKWLYDRVNQYHKENSIRIANDIFKSVTDQKKLPPKDTGTGQLSLSHFDELKDYIEE